MSPPEPSCHSPLTTDPLPRPSGRPYSGRFAPSPTGPLHFGSLVTALGGFLQARRAGGTWALRIDDIDPARDSKAAVDRIPRQLAAFGLGWDGPIIYQSARAERHREVAERLLADRLAFRCACTRRELAAAPVGPDGPVYPGTCRQAVAAGRAGRAIRLRVEPGTVAFIDPLQGAVACDLASELGDFVIRRADGPVAYQLAAALDDVEEGYTEVVRGADLLYSTLRQLYLQRLLGLSSPRYLHLPVAVNGRGEKLSKQTHAAPLDSARPGPQLAAALDFLAQQPPAELSTCAPTDILAWAVAHWQPDRLQGCRHREAPAASA